MERQLARDSVLSMKGLDPPTNEKDLVVLILPLRKAGTTQPTFTYTNIFISPLIMKRRPAIISAVAMFVSTAGCLGPLSRTKRVPVTVGNYTESTKQVTVELTEDQSGEQAFSRTVEVAPDEETEFVFEGVQKDTNYDIAISTQSGASKEYPTGPAQGLIIRVSEDGITMITTHS
jgi:hypothetical protein